MSGTDHNYFRDDDDDRYEDPDRAHMQAVARLIEAKRNTNILFYVGMAAFGFGILMDSKTLTAAFGILGGLCGIGYFLSLKNVRLAAAEHAEFHANETDAC